VTGQGPELQPGSRGSSHQLQPSHLSQSGPTPAALASIRAQLPVSDGPIGVLGGSLGGAVDTDVPVPLVASRMPPSGCGPS
jgi:hypothetical protein